MRTHSLRSAAIHDALRIDPRDPETYASIRAQKLRDSLSERLEGNLHGLAPVEELLDAVWDGISAAVVFFTIAVPATVFLAAPIPLRIGSLSSAVLAGISWRIAKIALLGAITAEKPLRHTAMRWALARRWDRLAGRELARDEVRDALVGRTGESSEVEELMFGLAGSWDADAGSLRDAAHAVLRTRVHP